MVHRESVNFIIYYSVPVNMTRSVTQSLKYKVGRLLRLSSVRLWVKCLLP